MANFFDLGERVAGEPDNELEHFYICAACRQPIDKRDLRAVFHHEEPGHDRLPTQDATRLLWITDQLGRALAEQR